MLWSMVKSRNILIGTSFLSMWFIILSTNSSAAYSVQCFGLKPYWLSKNNLASLKYEDNWVKKIVSSTFDMVGNREIGL